MTCVALRLDGAQGLWHNALQEEEEKETTKQSCRYAVRQTPQNREKTLGKEEVLRHCDLFVTRLVASKTLHNTNCKRWYRRCINVNLAFPKSHLVLKMVD